MKPRLAFAFAAICASTTANAQAPSGGTAVLPPTARVHFDAGRDANQRGDFVGAITRFLAADDAAPLQPRIALELGWVSGRAGHDLAAAAWLRCYLALSDSAELTAIGAEILADRVDRLIALTIGKTAALVRDAVAVDSLLRASGLQITNPDEFAGLRLGITQGTVVRFEDRTTPSPAEQPPNHAQRWRELARVLSVEPTFGAATLIAEIDRISRLSPVHVPVSLARIAARRSALLDRYEQLDMLADRPTGVASVRWAVETSKRSARGDAEIQAVQLSSKGYPAYVERVFGPAYRVLVGDFDTRDQAQGMFAKMTAQGQQPSAVVFVAR